MIYYQTSQQVGNFIPNVSESQLTDIQVEYREP